MQLTIGLLTDLLSLFARYFIIVHGKRLFRGLLLCGVVMVSSNVFFHYALDSFQCLSCEARLG